MKNDVADRNTVLRNINKRSSAALFPFVKFLLECLSV